MEPDISWSPFMVKVSSILGLEGHCSPRDDPKKKGGLGCRIEKTGCPLGILQADKTPVRGQVRRTPLSSSRLGWAGLLEP